MFTFATPDGDVTAVNDLNFTLRAGETLWVLLASLIGEIANGVRINGTAGDEWSNRRFATFNGREILNLPERELAVNTLRAEQISMIFQTR